jgi:hypothetical protein
VALELDDRPQLAPVRAVSGIVAHNERKGEGFGPAEFK